GAALCVGGNRPGGQGQLIILVEICRKTGYAPGGWPAAWMSTLPGKSRGSWQNPLLILGQPDLLFQPSHNAPLGQVDGGDAQSQPLGGFLPTLALDSSLPEGLPG